MRDDNGRQSEINYDDDGISTWGRGNKAAHELDWMGGEEETSRIVANGTTSFSEITASTARPTAEGAKTEFQCINE